MAKNIVLFNNKGGVGKTTFLFHLGYALEKMGKKILFVDLDPQCNLTSCICTDEELDTLWKTQNSVFYAVEPLIKGTGDIADLKPYKVKDREIRLIAGDLLLSGFEELLSSAWTDTLAGNEIGFRRTSSIYRLIKKIANANNIDYVLVDVGPNLGSLNRSVLLSCDYFFVPLVPDLFSLRGLENIGITFKKWIDDWTNAKNRFIESNESLTIDLQNGKPVFAGYINQQFNIYRGVETKAWKHWSAQVPQIIEEKLISKLREIDENMVLDLNNGSYKLGNFKSYHSLAPKSQQMKKPIFELSGPGIVGIHKENSLKCKADFEKLAKKIIANI